MGNELRTGYTHPLKPRLQEAICILINPVTHAWNHRSKADLALIWVVLVAWRIQ